MDETAKRSPGRLSKEDVLLQRLEAMVPGLRARAQETERLRQLPPETMEEAWDSGFLSAFRPIHFGGSGLGLSALANGARILAHGCASTAWTLVFLAQHVWMFSKANLDVQNELLAGERPGTMAGALARLGTADPVEGGYLVTARSDWNSGVMHSDWVNFKVDIGGVVHMAILPVSDVTVQDVWFTSGMRGTSSNIVIADRAFVPYRRLQRSDEILGSKAHPLHEGEPFASYPFVPVVMMTMSAVSLGTAEAAVDEFSSIIRKRVVAFTGGAKQIDQPVAHLRLGEAIVELRAMQALWHETLARIIAAYDLGEGLDTEGRVSVRQTAAYVATRTAKLLGHITASAGGSSYFESCPLQRYQRDAEVLSSHASLDWDRGMQLTGRVQLGLPLAEADVY